MKLKVVLMEEAAVFIAKQPIKAQQKIYYNIFKVEEGIKEIEIFKKTREYGHLGIQNPIQWDLL